MSTGRPTALAFTELVVVEAHQAGLRYRRRQRVEAVEPATIRDEIWPLLLEDVPYRLVRPFRMGMHLGVGDTFVGQPGVQLIVGFDPKPRREETFPDQTDLVLDLTLLPTRGRRAGHGFRHLERRRRRVRARRIPSPASHADKPGRTSSGCGTGGHAQPSRSP